MIFSMGSVSVWSVRAMVSTERGREGENKRERWERIKKKRERDR